MGDKTVPTPNIDNFARQNVRFDNCYVTQASSSPSRSSIFTGLYPHQNGQVGNANHGFATVKNTVMLPKYLHESGYRTGVIGKVHVKPYEEAFIWDMNFNPGDFFTKNVKTVSEKAREFINNSGDNPFFLKVSYVDTHEPFSNQVEDAGEKIPEVPVLPSEISKNYFTGKVVSDKDKEKFAEYYNGIKRLDYGIGLLLKVIEESGKFDNTLIIFFTGDNGGGPVQAGKMTCYETGVKAPLIVRYPGVQKLGQIRKEFVSSIDIFATVIEAAGLKMPEKTAMETEGKSLLPMVMGKKVKNFRKYVFTEMTYHGTDLYRPIRTIRDERYKLIVYYPDKLPQELLERSPEATDRWVKYVTGNQEFRRRIEPMTALYDLTKYTNFVQSDGVNLLTNGNSSDPVINAKRDELMRELEAWQYRTRDPLLRPDYLPFKN
jgi:N-sulfoglucosamine sulfohydrolase